MCVCVCVEGSFKNPKSRQERKITAERYCCDNTQPLLIKQEKLIHISDEAYINMRGMRRSQI